MVIFELSTGELKTEGYSGPTVYPARGKSWMNRERQDENSWSDDKKREEGLTSKEKLSL
jgi:hypothetical protein